MERETLAFRETPRTLAWRGDTLVDSLNDVHFYPAYSSPDIRTAYRGVAFDRDIYSPDGRYHFVFSSNGTKGLLFRGQHDMIREINRSYYCADTTEYPAAFLELGGRTFLIHCPQDYNRLDIEDVETGEILTDHPDRDPSDFFHSRLEVSPGGRYLVSKGWVWQPWEAVAFYDIAACLADPRLLDASETVTELGGVEINTASFIDDIRLLVAATGENDGRDYSEEYELPPGYIGIWHMQQKKIVHSVMPTGWVANLVAIDDKIAWDTFHHPKLVDIYSGEIIKVWEDIESGLHASSITRGSEFPPVAYNRRLRKLAIGGDSKIDILTV